MSQTLISQFIAARRAATPLICIRTADPAATMLEIKQKLNGSAPPILLWDIVNGLRGDNKLGKEAAASCGIVAEQTVPPVEALIRMHGLTEHSIVFFCNAHRIIAENGVSQAIWNLRDSFKANQRTLVMLCPSIDLPAEIQQDILTLDEPLPTNEQLAAIVKRTYKSANLEAPEDTAKAVDAICGLAAFPAEQVCSMSMRKINGQWGMDLDALWERKRQQIETTPGLSVWRGGEKFDDIGGCENIKSFMLSLIGGEEPPRAIVFQDEVEKAFAGSGTDTSGVTTEMEGTLLTWMQDHNSLGVVLLGNPGCAKSMIAKATGNTAGIPTIAFDLTSMKGSLVGESGQRLRSALKVVDAVSQGRALFVATANSMGALSPALRRRYSLGVFYFDLPGESERKAIWDIYLAKYDIKRPAQIPMDAGWTGAEIRNCCDISWRLKITLKQAAEYIVPISKSSADSIKRLREEASGRFISASYSGVYDKDRTDMVVKSGRKLELA